MIDDELELLRRYANQADESAFSDIVHRHLDLVWATAYRITGDADTARDVAQVVFSDLARKASTLHKETSLTGWLHRAASFTAAKTVRTESRRRKRERVAMENAESQSSLVPASAAPLMSALDQSINRLKWK